jgi:hypothetical protein
MKIILWAFLFVLGLIAMAFLSLIDAGLVNWMTNHVDILEPFTYGDWFWACYALTMPVGSVVGYGLSIHKVMADEGII